MSGQNFLMIVRTGEVCERRWSKYTI